MPEQAFLQLAASIGAPMALVCFFVWVSWRREKRLGKLLEDASKEINRQIELRCDVHEAVARDLHIVIEKSNAVIGETRVVMGELREETKNQTRVLEGLECLRPWDGKERRMGFGGATGE